MANGFAQRLVSGHDIAGSQVSLTLGRQAGHIIAGFAQLTAQGAGGVEVVYRFLGLDASQVERAQIVQTEGRAAPVANGVAQGERTFQIFLSLPVIAENRPHLTQGVQTDTFAQPVANGMADGKRLSVTALSLLVAAQTGFEQPQIVGAAGLTAPVAGRAIQL